MILTEDFSTVPQHENSRTSRSDGGVPAVRCRIPTLGSLPSCDRGAAPATRNVADFVDCDLTVIDPWR
jgi:hypothetical protein